MSRIISSTIPAIFLSPVSCVTTQLLGFLSSQQATLQSNAPSNCRS
ncbi:hypothetical protein REJ60_002361 [Salmonella enterica]|nr:hypothetical protein [Salmonella enterica]